MHWSSHPSRRHVRLARSTRRRRAVPACRRCRREDSKRAEFSTRLVDDIAALVVATDAPKRADAQRFHDLQPSVGRCCNVVCARMCRWRVRAQRRT
eukprot:7279314-Prymnesium_polylepis.2